MASRKKVKKESAGKKPERKTIKAKRGIKNKNQKSVTNPKKKKYKKCSIACK